MEHGYLWVWQLRPEQICRTFQKAAFQSNTFLGEKKSWMVFFFYYCTALASSMVWIYEWKQDFCVFFTAPTSCMKNTSAAVAVNCGKQSWHCCTILIPVPVSGFLPWSPPFVDLVVFAVRAASGAERRALKLHACEWRAAETPPRTKRVLKTEMKTNSGPESLSLECRSRGT